jgi:hypothetical protein
MNEVPPLGAVVQLKDGLDQFYSGAQAGWRATVKDHKVDAEGFDLIYVEWEQTGHLQKDGWTYPAHFEVIGQLSQTPEEYAAEMVAEADRLDDEDEVCPTCGVVHDDTTEDARRQAYLDLLSEAMEGAAISNGFALFFVQEVEVDDAIEMTPVVISCTLTEDAQTLIEAQVIKVSQMAIDKFMKDYFKRHQ